MANQPHQIWIRLGLDGSLENACLQEYNEHTDTFDDIRPVSSTDWPRIMSAINTAAMQKAQNYDALKEEYVTSMKRVHTLETELVRRTGPDIVRTKAVLARLSVFVSNETQNLLAT